jgi:hypothetical protein
MAPKKKKEKKASEDAPTEDKSTSCDSIYALIYLL